MQFQFSVRSRHPIAAATALGVALCAAAAFAAGPRAGEKPRVITIPDVRVDPDIRIVPDIRVVPDIRLALPRLSPRGWFGMALSCDNCSISQDDSGASVWNFEKAPKIYSVDPDSPADKGGIVPGDKLTHIDGLSITSREGGRRFGGSEPGDKVAWTIDHDGKKRVVTLVAEEHPDRDDAQAMIDGRLKETMAKLQAERDRMLAQRNRMHYEQEKQSLDAAARQLETAQRALERMSQSDYQAQIDAANHREAARHVRYRGTVGDSKVEVRGSGSVVVTEGRDGELVIDTPDATIRIEKK